MRTNKLKRSEKKRLKEEEREQRLREREIARLRRKKNRPLTFVSAFFILIFVSLIGYLAVSYTHLPILDILVLIYRQSKGHKKSELLGN